MARMLYFTIWPDGGEHRSYDRGFAALLHEPVIRDNLRDVIDLSFDQTSSVALELTGPLQDLPLRVHASYRREEILTGLGWGSLDRTPNTMREGVAYISERNIDALLVTLTKSEADYSPTTMYRDYPISPTLFHWESQSTTSIDSPTGRRYIEGSSTVRLFLRQHQNDDLGPSPYLFAGRAHYLSHEGSRRIAIRWALEHPLPAQFFTAASVAAL